MQSHDKLSIRITQMIGLFSNGEARSAHELAQEFGVNIRTIWRDLNRLNFLPLQKDKQGRYFLCQEALGKLGFKDIREFARLSGIWGLYPSLDDEFLAHLLEHNPMFVIKNQGFEDISVRKALFMQLSQAILKHRIITCIYKDKPRTLEPYRLLNNNGIWYLLATDSGTLKHFSLSRMSRVTLLEQHFTPSEHIESLIAQNVSTWVNQTPKTARLYVDKEAKEYFMRKHFAPSMRLEGEDKGGLYVRCVYSYDDEILNLAKLFLPYVRIAEPASLQEKLDSVLRGYLDKR